MRDDFVTRNVPERPTAVALGVFDGVHKGHRAVLKEATAENYLEPWVFTFSEGDLSAVKKNALQIEPAELKYRIMKKLGIAHIFAPEFSEVKELSGEEFVERVLVSHLKCRRVICGTDFRFGKGASCGAAELAELCKNRGIDCAIVEKLIDGGEAISSTRIRDSIKNGDMETASRLLGYPFCIEKEVVSGKHLGSENGVPTMNQPLSEGFAMPRFGVYVSASLIDGVLYPSVTDVGVKPTVSDENLPFAETNVIGFCKNVYGKRVSVFLLRFLRDEKAFNTKEELFGQILADRETAGSEAADWINKHGSETLRIVGT